MLSTSKKKGEFLQFFASLAYCIVFLVVSLQNKHSIFFYYTKYPANYLSFTRNPVQYLYLTLDGFLVTIVIVARSDKVVIGRKVTYKVQLARFPEIVFVYLNRAIMIPELAKRLGVVSEKAIW